MAVFFRDTPPPPSHSLPPHADSVSVAHSHSILFFLGAFRVHIEQGTFAIQCVNYEEDNMFSLIDIIANYEH